MKRILSLMIVATAVLMVSALPSSAITFLVANGGFETGDWTGWTQDGETYSMMIEPESPTYADWVHTGDHSASFYCWPGSGEIKQYIDTEVGQSYTFDFWLRYIGDSGGADYFAAQWGYEPLLVYFTDPISTAPSTTDWVHYSYTTVATAAETRILFSFLSENHFWALDDVSVTPASSVVPIPGAIWLFGSGLAGLVGIGRWRRRK